MRLAIWIACVGLLAPASMGAQNRRDFLTADEVDQIRLTQEPNARLKLYARFAQQRVKMIEQILTKDKPGRSAVVHETLEDYTKIIEAMDMVTDDALRKKADLTEGIAAIAAAEEEMLAILQRIRDSEPKDLARYQFALEQAIETTADSLELAQEDLNKRSQAVDAKLAKEKQEREAMMTPSERAEKKEAERKAQEEAIQKKAPTLRRKGELPTSTPTPKKQ
jgi:hypothetical protein